MRRLHLDRRVEAAQERERALGAVAADLRGAEEELAAAAEVVGGDECVVTQRHVPHAREHQILGHLRGEPARAAEQHARRRHAQLRLHAPQPDLAVVALGVEAGRVVRHTDGPCARRGEARGRVRLEAGVDEIRAGAHSQLEHGGERRQEPLEI